MGNTKYSLSETAAARQLAELPEQADDLRTRLAVAERRAESAEEAVQDARSELARAVLGAARAEADAVAIRTQAADELEQQAERLRGELAAAKASARASETELARLRARRERARKRRFDRPHAVADVAGALATGSLPAVRNVWRRRRDLAVGSILVLAVGAAGLLVNLSLLFDGGGLTKDGPALASGIAHPEDPAARAVAEALATIEQETRRLRAAAKATAMLRESLARRKGMATVAVSADRRPNGSWLLYMPVEHEAVRSYLLAPRRLGPSIARVPREDRARSAERRRRGPL